MAKGLPKLPSDPTVLRRRAMQAAAGAALFANTASKTAAAQSLEAAGHDIEIQIVPVSSHTFRLTVFPIQNGTVRAVIEDGSLVRTNWAAQVARIRMATECRFCRLTVQPAAFIFEPGVSPLLCPGEGRPQFGWRGTDDRMRSGQGGYQPDTHGGRVLIPRSAGTSSDEPAGANHSRARRRLGLVPQDPTYLTVDCDGYGIRCGRCESQSPPERRIPGTV
jgi:hypothetical protein